MKKKILLVTLFDNNNIGNRLQNFALYKVLQEKNVEVDVLDNGYTIKATIKDEFKNSIKFFLGLLGFKKYKIKHQKYVFFRRRQKANIAFNNKNIPTVVKMKNKKIFDKDWSEYDLAIVGSDQVWHNWNSCENELSYYYLNFISGNKRVAYAASFGFEEFPEKDYLQHKQGIEQMKFISCREKTGCGLVKQIIKKDVPKVLDPTLLLTAREWMKIGEQASKITKSQKNFAFVFFLGKQSEEYKKYINEIIVELGVNKIIDFNDFKNTSITGCSPEGFVSLINNADYIFTDSFHCTVFSLLFNKEFTVFRRQQPGMEKMFSRIEELLASKDKLGNIYGGSTMKATNDFEKLYSQSMEYIDSVLK